MEEFENIDNSVKGTFSRDIMGKAVVAGMVLVILITSTICIIYAVKLVDNPFPGFLLNERMKIATIGQYHWTGARAGLKNQDRLLKANGEEISSLDELREIINNRRVGEAVAYLIARGDRVIEVTVPTMRFTWFDLFMTFGITFFAGICYLIIGLVVFLLKPDTKVSWSFTAACFFLSLYSITIFDMQSPYPFGFIRGYLLASAFAPAAFVHFSLNFPKPSRLIVKHPIVEIIPYIGALLLIVPMELIYPHKTFYIFWKAVLIYMIVAAFLVVIPIVKAYFKPLSVLDRQRAKVVLLGAAVALPIPALAFSSQTFFGSFLGMRIQTNFLTLFLIIFPASIGYAIVKHNLFDVDVYVKRAVGYGIMTAGVAIAYFLLQLGIRNIILSPILGQYAEQVYSILFALLVVFLFHPVNSKVQGAVDRLFYRKKFDYKDTVISVSNALTSVLDLNEIIKRIIDTVRKEMFIDTAGIILLESPQGKCKAIFFEDGVDKTKDHTREECIHPDDPVVRLISRKKKLITKYDIKEKPEYASIREACGQRFSEMGASIAMPLIYQDEVVGILTVGYKKSGNFYTREDIELLETLANQGAIAIENAKLAEQMKREETVRTNLARYLSPQIVDQIVKKDVEVNLGGDRKIVTVLFSDIRNFTAITQTRPPDQLVRILNEYFTEMARIIFKNQGSLDKYIGDAVVAVFGSLISVENHAHNAVQASIEMMRYMPKLNERWMKEYGFLMDIGIGISTGEVFLGNIGSPERMEFTVIGDTVNVASRFSGIAEPGQVLISKETLETLDQHTLQYVELPPCEIKGKADHVEVFQCFYRRKNDPFSPDRE